MNKRLMLLVIPIMLLLAAGVLAVSDDSDAVTAVGDHVTIGDFEYVVLEVADESTYDINDVPHSVKSSSVRITELEVACTWLIL